MPHAGDIEAGGGAAERVQLHGAGFVGALGQQRPGLLDDPLALDLAERDQPRTDADEVGKRSVEEGEDCIVRGDSLRFRRCAEDHGLMPLRAPVAHRRGKGRKGGGREDVAIGAEQRAPGLERGLARLPAQLERAERYGRGPRGCRDRPRRRDDGRARPRLRPSARRNSEASPGRRSRKLRAVVEGA